MLNPKVVEEEHEEGLGAKGAAVPELPSKEEMDEHMLTHTPFRSWCKHCVQGKAKGKPHFKSTGGQKEVPCVVMDYMYMNSEHKEKEEEQGMPILVSKDLLTSIGGTGMIFARVVPNKGKCQYAIKAMAADLGALGHKDMVLKSDGEPAIEYLKEAVKAEVNARVVLETSPVGESKSNGAAENIVQ